MRTTAKKSKPIADIHDEQRDNPPSSPLVLEEVAIDQLRSHPRNYREHPDDEIEHLMESIRSNGVYRNIVIARDGTILAGHGVVKAAHRLGHQSVPVYRMPYLPDDPRALKLLVSDNEISHLAMSDDRALTEILRELKDNDDISGLLGTGYDEMMLANLVMVSRPAAEIEDLNAAAEWVGLPEYDNAGDISNTIRIIVNFVNHEDRQEFCRILGIDIHTGEKNITGTARNTHSIWWPKPLERDDNRSLRFVEGENASE